MKTTDLRLGNKLLYTASEKPRIVTIDMISWDKVTVLDMGLEMELFEDELAGIPLTSDMLPKFGLHSQRVHGGIDRWFLPGGSPVCLYANSHRIWFSDHPDRDIEYVHQLQNLIHAIMGEDAKIEL